MSRDRKASSRENVRRKVSAKKGAQSRPRKTLREHMFIVEPLINSKLMLYFFIMLMLILLSLIGSRSIYPYLNKPIDSVILHASLERVTPLEIEAVMSSYKHTGFLELSLPALRADLEALPWVDRAEVQRRWPKGLEITLVEQVAVARWGEEGLLNSRGELILDKVPQHYLPPELPRLIGPKNSEWRVAQRYLELHTLVQSQGLYIQMLEQDARGAWKFLLSNGTLVKLGKEATDERLRRFTRHVLPELLGKERVAEVLDMRYSNGYTVKWRQSVESERDGIPSNDQSSITLPSVQQQVFSDLAGNRHTVNFREVKSA